MTAGFFSPLPPAPTGVSDYSAALLEAMRRSGPVRSGADGDVNLYHLGNNALHREIYQRALARPGVVVLHDAVLHHFLLGTLSREEYLSEFRYNYGEWHASLAERLWANRARSAVDPAYFAYPMLRRAVENARAVIVHNAAAARLAAAHGARKVTVIPHLFAAPQLPPPYDVIRLRARLSLRPTTFLCGVFGHLRESKRLTSILRAFENVIASGVDAALLIAGTFVSSDLARAVEPLLHRDRVIRTGYLPEREFWLYASAVDAGINLRYPAAGESSGIATRLMGIGKPVLVTAGEEFDGVPETACLRVDAGPAEVEMTRAYVGWLAGSRRDAAEVGRRAAAHIAEHHAPARVAASYWQVLEA